MLELPIPAREIYDEEHNIFSMTKPIVLRLEHSLVSLSKWEMRWRKPFLDRFNPHTYEESLDYIRCMTLNQNVDPNLYYALTAADIKAINDYIESNLSATTFNDRVTNPPSSEIITSELIYYQMVAYRIPFECQKWHLSRLLTLIRILQIKSNPGKKMPKSAILARNRALNAARRKRYNTKG